MTRKTLPKAIRRTREDPRDIAAGAVTDEEAPAPRPASRFDKAEPALAISSLPVANDQFPAASSHVRSLAAKRRSLARAIVERHRIYAAAGGLLPLPIASVASVTAIIMRMVKTLSDLYGVPFERERTRSLIVGLTGGAVPAGLASATASTLAFAVPGSGVVGLAVSSITAAAFTRGIGLVFIEHFESGLVPRGVFEIEHA